MLGTPARLLRLTSTIRASRVSGAYSSRKIAVPIAIGTAIFLEEYAPETRLARIVEVNLNNLAGVPSIVYGILGLSVFVRGLQLGAVVLAAALTLSLLVVPVIVVAAREALKAVPD